MIEEGMIYGPVLSKLISSLGENESAVLFEMDDGTLKTYNEVEDFHKVKTALKQDMIKKRILVELFGPYPKAKTFIKEKHFDHFMALCRVVLDDTSASIIKRITSKYNLSISFHNGNEGKIASEKLRE